MLSRIRLWHILLAQVITGAISVAILAVLVRFPDVAHRPEPAPAGANLFLFLCMTIAIVALSGLYRRAGAHQAVATTVTVLLWLVVIYGFVFVLLNTYGE
jgi:hypothetical protein